MSNLDPSRKFVDHWQKPKVCDCGHFTKSSHDGREYDDANRLNAELPNWVLILVLLLHRPPCEEKNNPC